jgi:D-lactate dehydrogenase
MIMAGFGCKLLCFDPYPNAELLALGARYVSLPELLAGSHIISLHCPLTADNKHLINATSLATLMHGAMLINTGRGALVDTPALIEALKSGQLGYLGLDVYEEEPHVPEALIAMDNVVLLPHVASATHETRQRMSEVVFKNVDAFFNATPLPNAID